MATIEILEPNISQEENDRNFDEVKRVLEEIAATLTVEQVLSLEN